MFFGLFVGIKELNRFNSKMCENASAHFTINLFVDVYIMHICITN